MDGSAGQFLTRAAISVAGVEFAISLHRRAQRRRLWKAAQQRSVEIQRPLVVIGAPGGGAFSRVFGRDYDCGDLTIDIQPTYCSREMQLRAEDALPQLSKDSCVVFISCTLEYVDDADAVIAECRRIAGPHIFVVDVEPWSLSAWLYPGAKRRVFRSPKGDGGPLVYRPMPWCDPEPAEGGLSGLAGMRLFLPRR